MRNPFLFMLFAALLAGFSLSMSASSALAGAESYEQLSTAPSDYRASVASPLDGADSLDWSAPLKVAGADTSLIPTKGNPTVYVRGDLSVQSATCVVYCGLYVKRGSTYHFLGVSGKSTLTATAGTSTRAAGRYLGDSLLAFDTASATHVELRKEDPSGGASVSLLPWVAASSPGGRE